MRRALVAVVALAGCPKGGDKPKPVDPAARKDAAAHTPGAGDAGPVQLPPPPAVPAPPAGLPPQAVNPALAPTLALGDALFHDVRLGADGTTACATCHDPAHGFSGKGRQSTGRGQQNLRRAQALVNVAYKKELAWDGRYASYDELLPAHVKGQLGDDIPTVAQRLADDPVYRAHVARIGQGSLDTLIVPALALYVGTRYDGNAPWDQVERSRDAPADLKAGYKLFTGKAQCASCHPPPLYTDVGYHALGVGTVEDEGRGKVDPAAKGAFATPTVRGAAARSSFFHDGSVLSLEACIDAHLAGGPDPALKKLSLTPDERRQLLAFVVALTAKTE